MIDWFAALRIRQRKSDPLGGKRFIRGVGLDQKPSTRDGAKSFTSAALACVSKVTRQGKVRSQFGKAGDHLLRAAERMEHKAARGPRVLAQQFVKAAPCL